MPSRMLHESVLTSPTVEALTEQEEILFYRLILKCDDFGRFHGSAGVVRGACFPLRENVTNEDVEAWLCGLQRVGLICRYTSNGRQYLCFVTWSKYQRQKAAHSKFPEPPDDGDIAGECRESSGIVGNLAPDSHDKRKTINDKRKTINDLSADSSPALPAGAGDDDLPFDQRPDVEDDWLDGETVAKVTRLPTAKAAKRKAASTKVPEADVARVWQDWREFQPGARVCPEKGIRACLNIHSVDDCLAARGNVSADYYWRPICRENGAKWFYTPANIDRYRQITPREGPDDGAHRTEHTGNGTRQATVGGRPDDAAALAKYR